MSYLDEAWVTVPCPFCGFGVEIQVVQLSLGAYVLCPGCHETVRLRDPEASVHRANQKVGRMIQAIKRGLSGLGRNK